MTVLVERTPDVSPQIAERPYWHQVLFGLSREDQARLNIRTGLPPAGDFAFLETLSAVRGTGMGFLSSIGRAIGGVARFAGRALGILPPAAPAAVTRPVVTTTARRIAGVAGGLAATGAAAAIGTALATPDQVAAGMLGGGNGKEVTITVIQTYDRASGELTKSVVKQGSPFLMRKDLVTAKRVDRVMGRAARKHAARGRGKSRMAVLKDKLVEGAIHRAEHTAMGCAT